MLFNNHNILLVSIFSVLYRNYFSKFYYGYYKFYSIDNMKLTKLQSSFIGGGI